MHTSSIKDYAPSKRDTRVVFGALLYHLLTCASVALLNRCELTGSAGEGLFALPLLRMKGAFIRIMECCLET